MVAKKLQDRWFGVSTDYLRHYICVKNEASHGKSIDE